MAKITKLKSGSWHAAAYDYTDSDGRRVMRSFTSPIKAEVEADLAAFKAEKKARKLSGIQPDGRPTNKAAWTVGQILDHYIDGSEFLSPTTVHGYRKIRRNNFRDLMGRRCNTLTPEIVQAAINQEARTVSPATGQRLSAKSVRNAWGAIAAALNAELGLSFPVKLPAVKRPVALLPEPEAIMAAIKDSPAELPCLLALWLSYSMSEIRGLRCSDVDLERMTITIDQVMVDVGTLPTIKALAKTPTRRRTTELPQLLADKIAATENWQQYQATGQDGPLITMGRQFIVRRFKLAMQAAGIELTFHGLRHVYASAMLNKLGMPSKLVQIEGGWSTPSVMERVYSQSFSSSQKALHAARDQYFADLYNTAGSQGAADPAGSSAEK